MAGMGEEVELAVILDVHPVKELRAVQDNNLHNSPTIGHPIISSRGEVLRRRANSI
jgi:hypothetical protein